MNLLAVVTPDAIYNGWSTLKMFWEGNLTPGEFTPVNMKICGHCNAIKHRELNNDEKYRTLDINLKFDSLDKMIITYSEPKYCLERSGKGLITSLVLKTIVRSKKNKKARYYITNIIIKYPSKIINYFEKFPYKNYVRKSSKHEPTDSYFY